MVTAKSLIIGYLLHVHPIMNSDQTITFCCRDDNKDLSTWWGLKPLRVRNRSGQLHCERVQVGESF